MGLTKVTFSMIEGAVFNVFDYGAAGDNSNDDTSAIQAALDAIDDNGGGALYFPKGQYKTTATLTYPNSKLKIFGDGPTTSVIKPTNTSTNLFTISGNWITLSDFSVEPVGTFTNGYIFEFTTTSGNINMYNVTTYGGYNVVGFTGTNAAQTYIIGCTFNNFKHNGIVYESGYGGFGVLSSLNLNNTGDTNDGSGIYVKNGDTFTFENINIQACNTGVNITPPASSFVRNLFATNVLSDGVGRTTSNPGWYINGTTSGAVDCSRIKLTNCWAGAIQNDGFLLQGCTDVTIVNSIAIANKYNGFRLTTSPAASNVSLIGCTATGNSYGSSGSYSGIKIDDAVAVFTITNCMSLPIGSSANTQSYGINITGTSHDHYIVTNNQVWGNVTGAINDAGTGVNKIVSGNLTA